MKVRAVIVSLLFSITANAQTVLPNWLIDSMAFEVSKGRACEQVIKAQGVELEKQGLELIATGKALQLSQNESKTLSSLLTNAKESNEILTMQFQKDIKQERKKTRKWKGLAILEAVGFIGLLLLL